MAWLLLDVRRVRRDGTQHHTLLVLHRLLLTALPRLLVWLPLLPRKDLAAFRRYVRMKLTYGHARWLGRLVPVEMASDWKPLDHLDWYYLDAWMALLVHAKPGAFYRRLPACYEPRLVMLTDELF